jgi:hypothetical protein
MCTSSRPLRHHRCVVGLLYPFLQSNIMNIQEVLVSLLCLKKLLNVTMRNFEFMLAETLNHSVRMLRNFVHYRTYICKLRTVLLKNVCM